MANNFRFSGQLYVSKSGNDSNSGTADLPLASIAGLSQQGMNNGTRVIFGTGVYPYTVWYGGGDRGSYQADGKVVFTGDGATPFYVIGTPGSGYYNGIEYANFAGFSFRKAVGYDPEDSFSKCTFNVLASFANSQNSSGGAEYFYDCVFNNVFARADQRNTRGGFQFQRSLFINSNVDADLVAGCYFDATSRLTLAGAAQISGSNVQGLLRVNGDSFGFTDLATFKVNYGLQARADLISTAPDFNNVVRQNYTLKVSSPHLSLGIGPAHLRYSLSWTVASSAVVGQMCTPANTWLVNSADNSIVNFLYLQGFSWSQQGSLYITENTAGVFAATYRTQPLQVAAVAQVLKTIPIFSGYNFDSSYPSIESAFDSNQPDPQNNNVVCFDNYLSGDPGRAPHRLTVKMRWSTRQVAQDAVATDWVTGADFLLFEANSEPTWNQATSIGNGSPQFNPNPANVQNVRALWIQLEVQLINNYYSR